MSEYLRRFLRDYPGIADNPHTYYVRTSKKSITNPKTGEEVIFKDSIICFERLDDGNTIYVDVPMEQVGEFLYGLELYKMGQVNDE